MTHLPRLSSLLASPLILVAPLLAAVQDEEVAAEPTQEEESADEAPAPPKAKARKRLQGSLPLSWSEQLTWRSIGPANMGGRITCMDVHPDDSSTYWVGTAGGGLLKTINNGVTYEHQFTDQNTSSVGAVAVSPSQPEQVWVGTGENNPRNSVSWGDGVYKSYDGGASWHHMGLKGSFQISTIVVHPENPDIVYVGALGHLWGPNDERGLFKTTDGGKNWEKVLFVDDLTGVIDIRMQPGNSEVLLVATYERERDLYCSNDPAKKWGPGSGLYRTADGGATFTKITAGLPSVTLGRIGLDWYVADPNIVYAVVESERITQDRPNAPYMGLRGESAGDVGARLTGVTEDGPAEEAGFKEGDLLVRFDGNTVIGWDELVDSLLEYKAADVVEVEVVRDKEVVTFEFALGSRPVEEDNTDSLGYPSAGPFSGGLGGQRENIQEQQGEDGHEHGGLFRSDDAGLTWTRINSVNPRPMYYSEVRVDPSDSNHIYVLGTSLYRSKDGGETFTSDGHDRSVHVDHHAMWVDPRDGRHIMLGNDGGLYVTWDRMENWDHHNHVAIGQFYNITCDPTPDYMVYGGLQDNGSWGGPNRSNSDQGTLNTDWVSVGGGDGFVCRVDPEDPDLVYYESQNGGMGRRNLRTGQGGSARPSSPRGSRNRFNWNTPFILSSVNSRIFYCAGNRVFRSLDRGNKGRAISPDITRTERGTATSLAESPRNSDILYVGTDDGALWTTRNGGQEWIDLFALNGPSEEEVAEEEPAEDEDDSDGAGQPARLAEVATAPKARSVAWRGLGLPTGDDPLSGHWKCEITGDRAAENEETRFTLDLALDADGKLTGRVEAQIGTGEIAAGTWDPKTQELSFTFKPRDVELAFKATLDEGALKGSITGAGGAFTFNFEGQRDEKVETDEEIPEPAEEPEEPEVVIEPEVVEPQEPQEGEKKADDDEEKPKDKPKKFIKDTIDQLLPGRFYVSSITPSAHKNDWVYVTFDAHRSDDTRPYVFVSEDNGTSWESLRGNLPDSAGSVRDLAEDIHDADILYLGTEHRAYVSTDRGESWTELGQGLPTVAVHDLAQHPTSGELIAGTHGRSVWILDVTPLRQMTEKAREKDAVLFDPADITRWRSAPSRGRSGTRRFVGQNPSTQVAIFYSLAKRSKDVSLVVKDAKGKVVRELEASRDKGLHRVDWNRTVSSGTSARSSSGGSRRRGRSRSMSIGTYTVELSVGSTVLTQEFEVHNDPGESDERWVEYERLLEALAEGEGDPDQGAGDRQVDR
jgi:photosystem II stability/assembly factor-like uncharacterized protein